MTFNSTYFSRILSEYKDQTGLSDRAFSKYTGINRTSIYRYLKGAEPVASNFFTLCDLMGMPVQVFMVAGKMKQK